MFGETGCDQRLQKSARTEAEFHLCVVQNPIAFDDAMKNPDAKATVDKE